MTPFTSQRLDRLSTRHMFVMFVALVLVIGAFLFYWYEIRPVQIYRKCTVQASADAHALLKSKAQIAKGTAEGKQYDSLVAKNMYLRSDYASFLQKCLLY